ncbi:MAG: rubrerythrin family protein [Nitrososphaeria archaeon]
MVRKMTEKNLNEGFAGESMAHMGYLIFSEVAEKEGFTNVARLFKAIAYAEYVHAKNHLNALGKVKKSKENLDTAIEGETYEVEEMYPAFKAVAELQKENLALRSFDWAYNAEKIHAKMYEKAKASVENGVDAEIREIYICPLCGYTVEGEPPEKCPICGARKDAFKKF